MASWPATGDGGMRGRNEDQTPRERHKGWGFSLDIKDVAFKNQGNAFTAEQGYEKCHTFHKNI